MNYFDKKIILKLFSTMRNAYASLGIIALLLVGTNAFAQQDAQYTQYMYNTLSVNPAYAGTRDNMSAVLLHRSQWVGLDQAPTTQTFSLHSPLGEKVGLGLNIVRDNIFITSETYFDANFSYRFNVSPNTKLSLGLKAGGHILDVNFNKAVTGTFKPNPSLESVNQFSPQLGIGAFLYNAKAYFGVSLPNILKTEHFVDGGNDGFFVATERQHFYIAGGYVFDLSSDIRFKPAFLVKAVEGAPTAIDLSGNLLFNNRFVLGGAYRVNVALSAMAGFYVTENIQVGLSYDYDTTSVQTINDGSYEAFIRFELFRKRSGINNPRFF